MKDRRISVTLVGMVAAALLGVVALGAGMAQTAAPQAGARPAPAPAKASIEGTITRVGTVQLLRDVEISLRRPIDSAQASQRSAILSQLGPMIELFGGGGQRGGASAAAIFSGPAVATAFSDKQGHFVITDIEPGDYIIAADRDGYVRQEYGQRTETGGGTTVSLAAGKRVTLDFQLVAAGVISGRIIDTDGSSMADARVRAYTFRYSGGKRSLVNVGEAQSNDLGEYRLYPLTAGTYFIAVTLRELPTDQIPQAAPATAPTGPLAGRDADIRAALERGGRDAAIVEAMGLGTPPIYYPGSLDPFDATPIRVDKSEEVRGMDFFLHPIRMVKVNGRILAPFELPTEKERKEAEQSLNDRFGGGGGGAGLAILGGLGRGAAGQRGQGAANNGNVQSMFGEIQSAQDIINPIQVRFARVGMEALSPLAALIGNGPTPVGADGKFQITNVTPGSYNLTAVARDKKGTEYTARLRVEVGNTDIEGLTISPKPGADIKGQIYGESMPADFKPTQVRVSLASDDNPNALATMASLFGGEQVGGLTVPVQTDGSFLLKNVGALTYRVRVTGLPAVGYVEMGRYGDIDPLGSAFTVGDPETTLQLKLGFSAGNVSANIVDASGKPNAGILTALVPDEARRGRAELYFSASSDQNGRVTFANVPPGSYKIFAWEEIPLEAFRYAEFLRGFDERGVTVNVDKNAAITVEVKTIPKEN